MISKLPRVCYALIEDQVVRITRGEPCPTPVGWPPKGQIEQFNHDAGVTPAQCQAMIMGVLAGWDSPAADPDAHQELCPDQPALRPFRLSATVVFTRTITASCFEDAREQFEQEHTDGVIETVDDVT